MVLVERSEDSLQPPTSKTKSILIGGSMKRRIMSVLAIAGMSVMVAVAPASAYTSQWHSTANAWVDTSCASINHGHSSSRAFVNTGSCNYRTAIRAQYNEGGTDRVSAWKWGNTIASTTHNRIFLHQYQY